jgi:hypothetical protein
MRSIETIKSRKRILIRKKYIFDEIQNYEEGKKNRFEFVKSVSYYLKKYLYFYVILRKKYL